MHQTVRSLLRPSLRGLAALVSVTCAVSLLAPVASAQSTKRTVPATRVSASRAPASRTTTSRTTASRTTAARPAVRTDSAAGRLATSPAPATSFAALASAMRAGPANGNRLVRTIGLRADRITLIDVRNVFKQSTEQREFETAIATHARDVTAMRSTLQGSTVLRDLLYDRQLTMSQVVAVDMTPDGRGAYVYYRSE